MGNPVSGNTGGGAGTGSGGTFSLGKCFDYPFSITDVGEDMSSTLHTGQCILQWLFEPQICGSTVTFDCVQWPTFDATLKTQIPTAYVVESFTAATTLYNGITTALGDGACDAPAIYPWASTTGTFHFLSTYGVTMPVPSDLGCSGPNSSTVGNIFGWRPWIYDFEVFSVYLTLTAILWRMSPWHRNGDGIEIIESFGGLNIWGDYIPTHQTNEGSD